MKTLEQEECELKLMINRTNKDEVNNILTWIYDVSGSICRDMSTENLRLAASELISIANELYSISR